MDPEANVRRIVGDDGRLKLQMRVCVETYHGILQLNCDGRPDGERPHGREFALEFYEERARREPGFALSSEQTQELFEEGLMTYHRYVLLLRLGDHQRVIRDTERNMRLFRFVNSWAADAEDRERLEKWWPYIIRIHHTARAMECLEQGDFGGAAAAVRAAREQIAALTEMEDEVFQTERERSESALAELEQLIDRHRPLTAVERLEREKDEAVENEDFELAARLRDEIARMKSPRSMRGTRSNTDGSDV
jgi:hypothetical protein